MSPLIREERAGDEAAIREVIQRAFASAEHSDGTEALIVERLRCGALPWLSLVADDPAGGIVGHIAFSPVTISDGSSEWWGLAPLAVRPDRQRHGIGSALVEMGLARLQAGDAGGCVVLGNPTYYARFGFAHDPALSFPGPPAPCFQFRVLEGRRPQGVVSYAAAFG